MLKRMPEEPEITDRELLRRIARSAGQKAGYKQLVRELGLGGGKARRLLTEQLTRLVARRELIIVNNDMWAVPPPPEAKPAAGKSRFAGMEDAIRSGRDRLQGGRLDLHRDGFGFVRMEAASGAKPGASGEADIFIPPNEINGAMQGDLVLVDEMPPARDGRRSGRIARVLTRRNPTVVGIFHYGSGDRLRDRGERRQLARGRRNCTCSFVTQGNYVTPIDERVASQISIPAGAEVVAALS